MGRPRIFIASSGLGLGLAQGVYALLSQRHKPILWNEPGVFPASGHPLEALVRISRAVQFAVFVATADDILMLGGKGPRPSIRDNVLVEYTLFVGALDRPRCFFLITREDRESSRIPTDLQGLTMFAFEPAAPGAKPEAFQKAVHDACGKIEHQIGQIQADERRAREAMRASIRTNSHRAKLGTLSATIVTMRGMLSVLQKAMLENLTEADGFNEAKAKTVKSIRALAKKHEGPARELGVRREFDHLVRKTEELVESAPYPIRLTSLQDRLARTLRIDLTKTLKLLTQKDAIASGIRAFERELQEALENTVKDYGSWWDRATQELRDAADAAADAVDRRREALHTEASLAELSRALPSIRLGDLEFD